jgi:NAD(P)-dependent dehydrogenase (short-subunit alcohol dehydrogenase family)
LISGAAIKFKKEVTMANEPVALVTGANQGIGVQIAKDLVLHGFTVLVGSRNFEKGPTAAKSIGANAHAVQLDVTDNDQSRQQRSVSARSLAASTC